MMSKGVYKNEVDKPAMPMERDSYNAPGMSLDDFKGDADPIAYGQASDKGCKSDSKKIHSQFKNYGWD